MRRAQLNGRHVKLLTLATILVAAGIVAAAELAARSGKPEPAPAPKAAAPAAPDPDEPKPAPQAAAENDKEAPMADQPKGEPKAEDEPKRETLVVAGGCFWCVEGVFEQIDGVVDATSGYAGGSKETANYKAVCTGRTGHAEAVRITYDPEKVSRRELLEVFFTAAHDPTQLNRQGPDVGTQYRSAIFYATPDQKREVEAYIEQLRKAEVFDRPIVTKLEPLEAFYPAEDYHQDYVQCNLGNPYVRQQALPKIKKVREKFAEKVRDKSAE